jgi:hypothetical protein
MIPLDWPTRKMPVKKAKVPILAPKPAYKQFLGPYFEGIFIYFNRFIWSDPGHLVTGLLPPPAIKLEHYSAVKERSSSQLAELFQNKSSARFSQPGYESRAVVGELQQNSFVPGMLFDFRQQ